MSQALDTATVRFLVYDVFSTLFYYNFRDEDYESMTKKLKALSNLTVEGVDIGKVAEKVLGAEKKDLLIEYTTLFLTGTGVKPLTPVESKRFYSLMGEGVATFRYNDILRFYRSRNLRLNRLDFFAPEPDHVATILAFMAYLIREEAELKEKGGTELQRNLMDQRNFFTTHVYGWMPDWANDVVHDPRANIYKVVCEELGKWLELERRYLLGGRN